MQDKSLTFLPPGSTIGIMGGGQLGRMLALAAARLGFHTHIFCPNAGGPAAEVSTCETNAAYDDLQAVKAFTEACDVVTYEFENVPASSAMTAAKAGILRPNAKALDVAQDRLTEKNFIRDEAGVAVADFRAVDTADEARRAVNDMGGVDGGLPAVIKTRRFGYDGKGQVVIRTESDIATAFDTLPKGAPCILEAFVPFKREVSVVAARGANGEHASYPVIENVHLNHILHTSTVPAPHTSAELSARASELAFRIMDKLDYVGVMATEFFELEDSTLIVNEIAPRVHNSGHWSQDAGCVDQFELHIRAIAGWPLGSTEPLVDVVMTNLIGDDVDKIATFAAKPNTHIHLYGKSEARAGRKMGHVNQVSPKR